MQAHKTLLPLERNCFLTTREAAWYIILIVSVCQTITFENLDVGSTYLHIQYIPTDHGPRIEFVSEGHWVKVKVTGAKKVENSYSRKVKLRSAITPVLANIQP